MDEYESRRLEALDRLIPELEQRFRDMRLKYQANWQDALDNSQYAKCVYWAARRDEIQIVLDLYGRQFYDRR